MGRGHPTSLPQNAGDWLQQVSQGLPMDPDVSWQKPTASSGQSGQEAPARAASALPCPARVSSAFLSHGLQPRVWQGRVRHEVTAPEQESQEQEEAYLSPY